ncbi:SHOCT domain-containing protein [Streptacidiphilus fuscans]|uniref:SHOCT domain-containing protein n=1 Tax=Streptacidiphilus fuscans TaxID=2789292 RepID=A0A931B9Y8_9ACTN|nr:SHOCT domain-containing protein [Streptacidiphilus fuscans]MBF9073269.1 SHOCT domain-containing protein [Streptacidiphilus fuscans]
MRPAHRVVVRPVGSPLLRGALVGGAAYAAGRSRARAQADEAAQDQAIADLQSRQAAAAHQPPAPATPLAADDVASKLAQLGTMVQQGLLTPEEFAAAKAKLLS